MAALADPLVTGRKLKEVLLKAYRKLSVSSLAETHPTVTTKHTFALALECGSQFISFPSL